MKAFLFFCVLLPILILGAAVTVGALIDRKTCEETWKDSAFEHRWGLWSDCQIKTKQGWIPARSYRAGQE